MKTMLLDTLLLKKLLKYLNKKMKAITSTNFNFPNQKDVYNGKVRDVYNINDEFLTMIVTSIWSYKLHDINS